MQSEKIGNFQIEYSARPLRIAGAWGAWVSVYGPSPNPMHRNPIFPARRVAPDRQYADKAAAQEQARIFAHSLVERDGGRSAGGITRDDFVPL